MGDGGLIGGMFTYFGGDTIESNENLWILIGFDGLAARIFEHFAEVSAISHREYVSR